MRSADVISELLRHPVIRSGDHPGSARTLSRLAARGVVARLFPGIYAHAKAAENLEVRCAALMLWDPDAVITGHAAARLSFWPQARVDQVEFHSLRKKWAPPGFRLHRSPVPEQDVVVRGGLRLARAAWLAVHLARVDAGHAIDEAFRRTGCSLPNSRRVPAPPRGVAGGSPTLPRSGLRHRTRRGRVRRTRRARVGAVR